MANANGINDLDFIRLRRGAAQLKGAFHNLVKKDRQKAADALNDERLSFPSLFLLREEIEADDLYQALNVKNITAIQVCAKKLNTDFFAARLDPRPAQDKKAIINALKWMFETGAPETLPDTEADAFDAVMDAAAALLILKFGDKSILPKTAELIFQRNRKGLLIHDLVWSYFQSQDPHALRLIAEYIPSGSRADVELACSLLHLPMPEETNGRAARQKLYEDYLRWLNENGSFLYLTGEHLQFTSNPEPWKVDLEAKYLCKKISPLSREPIDPVSENEINWLHRFRRAEKEDQKTLSAYSQKMHDKDIAAWSQWMQEPSGDHIGAAKANRGGSR